MIKMQASLCVSMASRSRGVAKVLMGTSTPPASQTPKALITQSGRLAIHSATVSPGRRPVATNPRAIRRASVRSPV